MPLVINDFVVFRTFFNEKNSYVWKRGNLTSLAYRLYEAIVDDFGIKRRYKSKRIAYNDAIHPYLGFTSKGEGHYNGEENALERNDNNNNKYNNYMTIEELTLENEMWHFFQKSDFDYDPYDDIEDDYGSITKLFFIFMELILINCMIAFCFYITISSSACKRKKIMKYNICNSSYIKRRIRLLLLSKKNIKKSINHI